MEETIKEGKISIVAFILFIIRDCFAMMILIGFYWAIRDVISFFTTKITITNKRVMGSTGLFNVNRLDSPLNKINGVQVKQGIFGQILNYGTVRITTASTFFDYHFIYNPNEFKTILNNQIEKYDDERIEKQAKKLAEAMK